MAETELAFRPLPDYELRVADVAWVSAARLLGIDPEGYFRGVPELVVEVTSPSNSAAELKERIRICLENGGIEFWTVDPSRQLTVTAADGRSSSYNPSDHIALSVFSNTVVRVREITG